MAAITRFEEIESWQLTHQLTNLIYDFSDEGQFTRNFSLRDQMRRAVVAIMNISLKDLRVKHKHCL